jgi:GTP cyclohydrolase I
VDKKKIEKAIFLLLEGIGEDTKREGLRATPKRVAQFYTDYTQGLRVEPQKVLAVYYEEEKHEEIVLVKDISFYSLCEHHLLPFFGKVHVAYLPQKRRLLGLSTIIRLVDLLSRSLQLQERLTKRIAEEVMAKAQPIGVAVVIEAEHFCLTMRGVQKPGTKIITSSVRGLFLKDAKARAEVLSLITEKRNSS